MLWPVTSSGFLTPQSLWNGRVGPSYTLIIFWNLSHLFLQNLVWAYSSGYLTPQSLRRGRAGPCHSLPQVGFSASGGNSRRCRWSSLGSMNYHNFEWTKKEGYFGSNMHRNMCTNLISTNIQIWTTTLHWGQWITTSLHIVGLDKDLYFWLQN